MSFRPIELKIEQWLVLYSIESTVERFSTGFYWLWVSISMGGPEKMLLFQTCLKTSNGHFSMSFCPIELKIEQWLATLFH